MFDATIN
jgi:hypothetical protein